MKGDTTPNEDGVVSQHEAALMSKYFKSSANLQCAVPAMFVWNVANLLWLSRWPVCTLVAGILDGIALVATAQYFWYRRLLIVVSRAPQRALRSKEGRTNE